MTSRIIALVIAMTLSCVAHAASESSVPQTKEGLDSLTEYIDGKIRTYNETRDNFCARTDEACAMGINDAIELREKQLAALTKAKEYLVKGEMRQADRWVRYYNAHDLAATALYNNLLQKLILKVSEAIPARNHRQ